jgi:TRAP-type C4-dicarboxylate transport system substrate-binding protein
MKLALVLAAFAAAAAGSPAPARAQPAPIKFAIPTPPQSSVTRGLTPWAEEVTAASGGTLQIQVFPGPGVATIFNAYDRVVNNVVEMAFGNFGPLAQQFPKSGVAQLPFETKNGTEASLGFWRLYANGTIADEYTAVKPIALFTFPGVHLHGKKVIKNLADMKGTKISGQGKVITRSLELLGASPIALTVADLYSALSRGTVESVATAWSAIQSFKLDEQTSYHLEVPLGADDVYVVMNKDAYAKLPEQAKATIERAGNEVLVKRMIVNIDRALKAARDATAAMSGHMIAQLPPDEEARWAAAIKPVIDEWANDTPNGKAVLEAFRAEVKKIRAGGV